MQKVKILTDSTSDLTGEARALVERLDISIVPLNIILGDKSYRDGIEITPEEIFAWADEHRTTPKTSAVAPGDMIEAMRPYAEAGRDIVFIGISSDMSATNQIAQMAAAEFPHVSIEIVDSRNLSTGIGMQALFAAELAEQGHTAQEIARRLRATTAQVRASFLVDTITYLYRGGRCTAVQAFGATALKLKPEIVVTDGKMHPAGKFRGSADKALPKYVQSHLEEIAQADPKRIFITHSIGTDEAVIQAVREMLQGLNRFESIIETVAGGVISSHCGPGTLGILYHMTGV